MNPIKFKDQNITYIAPLGMKNCGELPALMTEDHHIISCWRLTLKERIRALLHGVIWLGIHSATQPPVFLSVTCPYVIPNQIVEVGPETARRIIDERSPRGKFFYHQGAWFVGIDNTTGNAWAEEFRSRSKCLEWLGGRRRA